MLPKPRLESMNQEWRESLHPLVRNGGNPAPEKNVHTTLWGQDCPRYARPGSWKGPMLPKPRLEAMNPRLPLPWRICRYADR